MRNESQNNHFRTFAKALEHALVDVKTDATQKQQVDGLIKLERQFKQELQSHRKGLKVYDEFMKFILEDKKNILAARPYFRERQKTFSTRISPVLKNKNVKGLYRFSFNYIVVMFAMKAYTGKGRNLKILKALAKQIGVERDALIQRNMPLAINRAKLFWSRVPKAEKEYMDFIQLCNEGLISAVDKFVPPYRTVFRSVAIGRMVGNMTEASSDTVMHFYPSDKRILYKANAAAHRQKLDKLEDVLDAINQDKQPTRKATRRRIEVGLEVVVKEKDTSSGRILNPKKSIVVTELPHEVDRLRFRDKVVGEQVKMPNGTTLEILALFEVVTRGRLINLLRGATHVSMDATLSGVLSPDPDGSNLDAINTHSRIADLRPTPSQELENLDTLAIMKDVFANKLSTLERKVLILKGEYCD